MFKSLFLPIDHVLKQLDKKYCVTHHQDTIVQDKIFYTKITLKI